MSLATFVHRVLGIWRSYFLSLVFFHTLSPILCACGLACIAIVPQVYAANVSLVWDASPSPDVQGYQLYHGTAPGIYTTAIDIGKQTTHTVTSLTEGQTYYFAATAYNAQREESGFSNEVSYTVPSLPANTSPAGDTATGAPPASNTGTTTTPTGNTGTTGTPPASNTGTTITPTGNTGTTGTPPGDNIPPVAIDTTAALTVSLGEHTPTTDIILTASTHAEILPVLQIRVDIGEEDVSLTEVTVAFSPSLDAQASLDTIAVQLLHDLNGNGHVDAGEPVLAMAPLSDATESLTLTFATPLDLTSQTTTYLLITLGGASAELGTRTTTTPPTRTGWLLLTPVAFGVVLFSRRSWSPTWMRLPVLLVVCSVVCVSCNNAHETHDAQAVGEEAVTLTLSVESIEAEGARSGALSSPMSPLTSPQIVIELP